ncbi:MAG: hypothetical protein GY747_02360 [Planctomycetes bacterium]|nr:hypothetical protein [Planctomycetota bacterium]MCP4770258.1 hypothetical protein [Planctomycetota bacterium]MCP4860594.1 hypothetical protein [Planctomycetota bacterium]
MKNSLTALALLAFAPSAFSQTTHTVTLTYSGNRGAFTPNELTIELGDTVHWDWQSGYHSVDSFAGLFSSGPPLVGPFTYDVVFDQAFLNNAQASGFSGTSFDYFCTPHLHGDMVGNVTVALPSQPLLEVTSFEAGSTATVSVSRGTSNQMMGIAYSLSGAGPTLLPAGPCGPILAELSAPVTIALLSAADASGTLTMSANIPAMAQGISVYWQALDLASCTLSNSGTWRIR